MREGTSPIQGDNDNPLHGNDKGIMDKISVTFNTTKENKDPAEQYSAPNRPVEIKSVKAMTRDVPVRQESNRDPAVMQQSTSASHKPTGRKKMKKSIFISYSPDAGFIERKFVSETVHQMKENSLSEDIWFDKDEKSTDSPCWFSSRMEAVERCRAAILFFSDSYFSCPVSIYEGKTLLERQKKDPRSVRCYPVLFDLGSDTEIPKSFSTMLAQGVDLTKQYAKQSLAEKTSIVIGSLMMNLERHASIHAVPRPVTPNDIEYSGEYRKKKICQWKVNDLQEWLFRLGIKEFYRQSLAEYMVDGFLLMSINDQDMIHHLGIDSRAVRKKIMQQILVTLDKEHQLPEHWHLRARTQRPKPSTVYLVYDPADVRLAQNLKMDLAKKGLNVIQHTKLGQSKEEFLQLNGPQMATATSVVVLLTDAATHSPFVYHEILFSDWLGKRLVTAMFRNTWGALRASLKAVLGECAAVDFETQMYQESLDILQHHLKPLRTLPGVVLEQAYLDKMADGLRPLAQISASNAISSAVPSHAAPPQVYISYQWDQQARAEDIKRVLDATGYRSYSDTSASVPLQHQGAGSGLGPPQRGLSSVSSRSGAADDNKMAASQQRNIRESVAVLCCITAKFLQSDSCVKDLTTADLLRKPILPVMLRFCPWPPEGAPSTVRKILARHAPLDLSTEKLFKQNIPALLDRLKKITGGGR